MFVLAIVLRSPKVTGARARKRQYAVLDFRLRLRAPFGCGAVSQLNNEHRMSNYEFRSMFAYKSRTLFKRLKRRLACSSLRHSLFSVRYSTFKMASESIVTQPRRLTEHEHDGEQPCRRLPTIVWHTLPSWL